MKFGIVVAFPLPSNTGANLEYVGKWYKGVAGSITYDTMDEAVTAACALNQQNKYWHYEARKYEP